jgi:very-short-patch-repair endonuclease
VKLFALLRAAKLPLPVPGYTVTDRGRFIARADLAYPERRLIIEAHSYRWHSGRKEWDRDIQRDKDLRRLGWRIIYVTYEDLTQRPEQVIADVRHGLGQGDLFA